MGAAIPQMTVGIVPQTARSNHASRRQVGCRHKFLDVCRFEVGEHTDSPPSASVSSQVTDFTHFWRSSRISGHSGLRRGSFRRRIGSDKDIRASISLGVRTSGLNHM